jgi:uncharacterized protein (TIGR02246 family)
MDASAVEAWLERYQEAWRTDDPRLIEELFSEDAVYHTGPWDEPWRGRDQIVAGWIERGDSSLEWEFKYEVLALAGEVAVIQGWTTYRGEGEPDEEFSNIWLLRFAPGGSVEEFREWWVERPMV